MVTDKTLFGSNGQPLALSREWAPAAVGINSVDMKAIVANAGEIISVHGFKNFHLNVKQVITGTSTVGAAVLRVKLFAEDRVTLLFPVQTILTALDIINAAGERNANLMWSTEGNIADLGLISSDATAPTNAFDLRLFKWAGWVQFILDVTTASDGTTHFGSVRLRAFT